MASVRARLAADTPQRPDIRPLPGLRGRTKGDVVRAILNGLLRGSRPAVALIALLAVAGLTATAYAKLSPSHHGDSNGKHASANSDKKPNSDFKAQKWHKAHHKKHDSKGVEYGVATVNVSRGGAPAVAWATYSTALGSPVGDTTGGVFRFTCSTANAPCTVSVKGAVLSDDAGTAGFYPRVLIYRQDYNAGGPEVYCEYGDGSTGSARWTLTSSRSRPRRPTRPCRSTSAARPTAAAPSRQPAT